MPPAPEASLTESIYTTSAGGLIALPACREGAQICTGVSLRDVRAAIGVGRIIVLRGAIDPDDLLFARDRVRAWNAPDRDHDLAPGAVSTRKRCVVPAGAERAHAFESFHFAVDNPADEIGCAVRPVFERLARYWRAASGRTQAFTSVTGAASLRARGLHYPRGAGFYGWHRHPLDLTRVGAILGLSRRGIDYETGGTEFRTPFGLVSTEGAHDLGDVCLFRYDLWHRVTTVDPGHEPGDSAGRWVFILSVQ